MHSSKLSTDFEYTYYYVRTYICKFCLHSTHVTLLYCRFYVQNIYISIDSSMHRTSALRATETSIKRSPVYASKCCLHSYILVHQIW